VFTAQKNANFPDTFVAKLKKFSEEHESTIVEFLVQMKNTGGNEEWIDEVIKNKNWF
jgi:mRNA-degrading endonuclease RelE of RelBE toxin-antitoxin system